MISIIEPDGLLNSILLALGINISSIEPDSIMGITCIVIASIFVLAIVYMLLKCCFSLIRGGRL